MVVRNQGERAAILSIIAQLAGVGVLYYTPRLHWSRYK